MIQELFEQAKKDVELLPERPSNETLLLLYALYKQATEGENNNPPPENPFDFVSKAKFDAWKEQTGKSKEDAMQDYINLVQKLKS